VVLVKIRWDLNEPTVVWSILRQIELLEDLGRRPKQNRAALLSNCESRDRERISSRNRPFRRTWRSVPGAGPADRQTTKYKRARVAGHFLALLVLGLADQFDGLDPLLLLL
jgi:hypothetical protein